MPRPVAILTGDLVGSTSARPETVEATMTLIQGCAAEIGPHSAFTRFRGDGWQVRVVHPGDCLWACLLILARLRADRTALGCRIAVGIGQELSSGTRDLSSALGPAFTASGRALDGMRPGRILALGDLPQPDPFRQLAFTVAGELVSRWSHSQAEAAAMKLASDHRAEARRSNEAIAQQLGITRQAVDARLKAADYPLLEEMVQAFRDAYPERVAHG